MNDQALFGSVEEALTFAFYYAAGQSPRTPMTALVRGGAIGKGKGLHGVDGAAQAAMILRKLDDLPKEQRQALTVRFGDVEHECPCCGHPSKSNGWKDAVDGLSWGVELEGIPKQMRHAMIANVLCRQKADLAGMSQRYGLVRSTTYRQKDELKKRLNAYEQKGLDAMRDALCELLPKAV